MRLFPCDSNSPGWLTNVLQSAGTLSAGAVTAVQTETLVALNSAVERLTIQYSADAPQDMPRQLILKRNANHDGMCEAPFYRLVMALPQRLPMLARCYSAAYDPSSGDSFCLLEDLSATHAVPITRAEVLALCGVPTNTQLEQMTSALAQFHAYWWQHPGFSSLTDVLEVRPWYRDAAFHEQHVQRRTRELAQFVAQEDVPAELILLLDRALAKLPKLWQHYIEPRATHFHNLTLSNGDCYFAQFLCPRSGVGNAYLIDFQDASVNFGPYDLVYMFAAFWTREQRQEHNREMRLLRHYHQSLLAHGVRGYDWQSLLVDYRLMVNYMLFDAVWNAASGSSRAYWWPKLQCLAQAYYDLDCANL